LLKGKSGFWKKAKALQRVPEKAGNWSEGRMWRHVLERRYMLGGQRRVADQSRGSVTSGPPRRVDS